MASEVPQRGKRVDYVLEIGLSFTQSCLRGLKRATELDKKELSLTLRVRARIRLGSQLSAWPKKSHSTQEGEDQQNRTENL